MPSIPTSAPDACATTASREPGLRRRTVAGLRALAYGLLTLASIASVLWLVLQWGILPRIESWRPALEQRAGAVLGVPLRIGALRAVDGGLGWAGGLELEEVVLLDPRTQQEALRLPRVRATVSATSLLPGWDGAWRLRLRQLLIEAPVLDVRRDAEGRLSVAGLEFGRASGDDGAALEFDFDYDGDDPDPDGYGWRAGAGLKYFVSDAFAVNASVNYAASYMEYEGTDWDSTGFLFGAGFSVYLK